MVRILSMPNLVTRSLQLLPTYRFIVMTLLIAFGASYVVGQDTALKSFTVDDMLHLEEFGGTSFSSDGESLAYVIKRGKVNGAVEPLLGLNNNEHADIWITSINGGAPINITNGVSDGSGYWAPCWSPNGEKLAFMGIRNGNIQLYLWTKKTKGFSAVTNRSIANIAIENTSDPYLWISDSKLLFVTEKTPPTHRESAIAAWSKAQSGKSTSASVLESGVPPSLETRPQKELELLDLLTHNEQIIAAGAGIAELTLSPDRQHLVFYKQVGVWQPASTIPINTILWSEIYQPMITDFKNDTRPLGGVTQVLQNSLLWSPKSDELALIGFDEPGLTQKIFRCNVAKSACAPVSANFQDLDPNHFNRFVSVPLTWLPSGELLLFSHNEALSTTLKAKGWWAIGPAGQHRELFTGKAPLPTQVLTETGRVNLIAVVGGELWRMDEKGELVKKIVPDAKATIQNIVWTDRQSPNTNLRARRENASGQVEKLLIARGAEGATANFYLINTQTGAAKTIRQPGRNSKVLAVDTRKEIVTLESDDENGIRIWTTNENESSLSPILDINGFLRDRFQPKLQRFQYYGGNGELLNAWIMLPNNYRENQRYPTIVWVYPSTVYSDSLPRTPFLQRSVFNLSLLAAHGYVVLLPSIPLKAYGEPQDTYPELSKGVLPAIDALIAMGIADPDRLGLMGHSYGGYASYSLVTQTKRFKAAVASAGVTNWSSVSGTFQADLRFNSDVHENLFRIWATETMGMGGPPWSNPMRYFLNSPVTYVDKVETPLLIIQGDLDTAGQIEQAEEFFSGLYRQNKRARFVRYFGEGHVIERPANVRDLWDQIFSWFDQFLKPKDGTNPTGGN